jgi:glycosyltransferase involved in cell wall biosynthesis
MPQLSKIRNIALIGDYLPRKCGIATFTSDLLQAVAGARPSAGCYCVALNDNAYGYDYPPAVEFEIEEQNLASYRRAADFLNDGNADVVCLQHEFGIYGGRAGSHILALLRQLSIPVVTTLHTILASPDAEQRQVMDGIISHSSRLVVMAERGRRMLREIYGVPAEKIDLIPHGIHDVAFADPAGFKGQFGIEGRRVLLTFGLLSPNKGIEHVINALPGIVREFPDVVYVVLGATHPNERREHGEQYRLGLEALARANNVERNVIFNNQFVDLDCLQQFIGAADIYITPYLNEAQITSGTLAYAFGSGKAVISTPYWHATELLANGQGVLVPFRDAAAIEREVTGLLRDDERRNTLRREAWRLGRAMTWANTGHAYLHSFERAVVEGARPPRRELATLWLDRKPRELPRIDLSHLALMTDSTGVFQHATYGVPNFGEGYCTDDNARAFILSLVLGELGEAPQSTRPLATTTAAFLCHAFEPHTGRFHNFMSFDRRWLDHEGSEDSHGRALWALGMGAGRSPFHNFQMLSAHLFSQALPVLAGFTSPRAWAFALIGLHEYLRRLPADNAALEMRELLTLRLMHCFDSSAQPDWHWFEDELAYDNATLASALILSGKATGQELVLKRGLHALGWLAELQIAEAGHFRPIGSNGFYRRGEARAAFDQQPIEAQATVAACLEAWRATGDIAWHQHAQRAFDWFLGWNDLGLEIYSPMTGGCCDGLHADRVNRNQGAESTLAFLLALVEMRREQNAAADVQLSLALAE